MVSIRPLADNDQKAMEIYFKNLTPEEGTASKLLQDLKTLRKDTEELFIATGDRLPRESKEKFLTALERLKETCHDIRDRVGEQAFDAEALDFPLSAVGVAFGLGFLIGIMAWRRG